MSTSYTDLQLDTLREVANIGSGTASTALAALLGRPIDISAPAAHALPLREALEAVGEPATEVVSAPIPVAGDIPSLMLALVTTGHAVRLAELLGAAGDADVARSALAEVGNILGTHYLTSLHQMTGLALAPQPPRLAAGSLGTVVRDALTAPGGEGLCLFIGSELVVEGESCSLSFLYVPGAEGADELLARLGMA